jgi:hypothetical protein
MKTSHLTEIGACSDAVAWVKSHKFRTLESAWKKCDNGSWMLWYAGREAGDVGDEKRKLLVSAACGCARLSLPIFEKRYPNDNCVRNCIETAEKWARNEATLEEFQVSRKNCYDAAADIYDDAASAASYAAYSAASYSASATSAASATSYATARSKTLKECADIVRKFYPELPT